MSTASTYVDFKQQLVTQARTAYATAGRDGGPVQVSYFWPSTSTEGDAVFLGRSDFAGSPRFTSTIPNITAGRKHRQEEYEVEVTIQCIWSDLNNEPDDAATIEEHAFSLLAVLDSLLANDPRIGMGTAIQSARLGNVEVVAGGAYPNPFGTGLVVQLVVTIDVSARLT